MKSIGKKTIHFSSFTDSILIKQWDVLRTVYVNKEGQYFINNLKDKKQIDNQFNCNFYYYSKQGLIDKLRSAKYLYSKQI